MALPAKAHDVNDGYIEFGSTASFGMHKCATTGKLCVSDINGYPLTALTNTGLTAELITNGDMALDANWTDHNTPVTNERSTEQKHAGTYSRKVVTNADNEGIYQYINTSAYYGPGAKFVASCWVYAASGTALIQLYAIDSTETLVNSSVVTCDGTWKQITAVSTTSPTKLSRVRFTVIGSNGITMYVDDASVKQIQGDQSISGDLMVGQDAKANSLTVGGAITAGASAVSRGTATLYHGPGGNTASYIKMYSRNGTAHFLWFEDDGTLKQSTTAPVYNEDGAVIGAQT